MIRVSALQHVNIVVRDVASARRFYGDFLGLSETRVTGQPQREVVWYQVGGMQLHVSFEPEPRNSGSGRHVAFVVDDVGSARRELAAAGYPVETARALPGIDRLFTRDPDGNRVELFAWSTPSGWPANADGAGV